LIADLPLIRVLPLILFSPLILLRFYASPQRLCFRQRRRLMARHALLLFVARIAAATSPADTRPECCHAAAIAQAPLLPIRQRRRCRLSYARLLMLPPPAAAERFAPPGFDESMSYFVFRLSALMLDIIISLSLLH
jgi:hypothetical protein